jgi:hypothetical protein
MRSLRAGLPHARQHDDSRDGVTEQEVVVVGEEDDLNIPEKVADSFVGGAAPAEGDDVIRGHAVTPQRVKQPEGKVLVEQEFHGAVEI